MKKKHLKQRAFLLILSVLMLMTACNSSKPEETSKDTVKETTAKAENGDTASVDETEAGSETESEAPTDLVTLQVFSMPSTKSGLLDNSYYSDILAKDVGVQIELLPASDEAEQKLQTLMASKSFPDIVMFNNSYKYITNAIEAGLIIDLDEHQDKLPNAYKNAATAIEYMRDNVSNGTGGVYCIPGKVTTEASTDGLAETGPYLRWDLYQELGSPELKDIEDYLPLMRDMLELEPENEEGQTNYGFSIWSDWDDKVCHPATVIQGMYGAENKNTGFVEVNYVTGEKYSIFDDESYYKRALKFYFDANQMGLVDPDSLTHSFGDVWDKQSAGRVMFANWSWGFGTFANAERDEQGIGYKPVYFTNEKQVSQEGPQYVGDVGGYSISTDTTNLDAALRFTDFMYSFDGVWRMALGEQGIYWDLDDDGVPYVTEHGWDMKAENLEFPNGRLVGDGLNDINCFGIPWRATHPEYGKRIDTEDWVKKDFAPADSALVLSWRETMGAQNDLDYITQHDLNVAPPFAPMDPVTDDIEQIVSRIADVVKTNSWQMIFAKDEAEFDALWADMKEKAEGMGVETADEWFINAYETALESGKKYMS